jgi:hypothetical protein
MRGERALLRIGEYLVGRACRHLPRGVRDERYREWVAELPAILHDREIRLVLYRAVRMLGYAADTLRGTALTPGWARRRAAGTSPLVLGLFFCWPGGHGLGIRDAARTPGDWVHYAQVAWALLLVAWPISQYAGSTARVTGLIIISSNLAGLVVCIGNAVQAPGDWVTTLSQRCSSSSLWRGGSPGDGSVRAGTMRGVLARCCFLISRGHPAQVNVRFDRAAIRWSW